MRRVSLSAASAGMTLVLLLAGCGADGSPPAETPVPVSDTPVAPAAASTLVETSGSPVEATEIADAGDPAEPTGPLQDDVSIGDVWEGHRISGAQMGAWQYRGGFEYDDSLWFHVSEQGRSVVYRSTDGVDFERVVTGDGRINDVIGDGTTVVGVGRSGDGAIVHLSRDSGRTWRAFQPPAMAISAGIQQELNAVTVHRGEFLAVGTIMAEDWRMVLYRSADGEDWSKVQEYRGEGHPLSGNEILSDGENLVVVGEDHLCSTPIIHGNAGGWYLTSWTELYRVYQGTSVSDLALLAADRHPFVAEPADYDCSLSTTELEQEYGSHSVIDSALVGGVVTLLGKRTGADDSAFELAELVDGAWVVDDDAALAQITSSEAAVIDDGGEPTVFTADHGSRRLHLWERRGGAWQDVPSAHRMFFGNYYPPVHFGEELYALSFLPQDRFGETSSGSAVDIGVWKNLGPAGSDFGVCPADSAECTYFLASRVDGYPALGAVDLSGKTLDFAEFGGADLTGADFSGAQLFGAYSDLDAVLAGADFSGANVAWAVLENVDGADFTGADVRKAMLTFTATTPIVAGANLAGASLRPAVLAFDQGPWEISLSGTRLQDATIAGGSTGERSLIVTSLRDAELDGASFRNVDLSRADITGTDLSKARFDAASICPDGTPAVDLACA